MRLHFKQTPNPLHRLFGRGLAHGKEYYIINEAGQTIYSLGIDYARLFLYDSAENNIATIQREGLGISTCSITGVNGMCGMFEWLSNNDYQWANAGYYIKRLGGGVYDVIRNNTPVMRISKKSKFMVVRDNNDYYLDLPNPQYMLDGLAITAAMAHLSYRKAKLLPLFPVIYT